MPDVTLFSVKRDLIAYMLDECALGTHSCQQRCVNGLTPVNNYTCGCYNGFKVNPQNRLACLGASISFLCCSSFFNNFFLLDINECTELTTAQQKMHACSDKCVNGLFPFGSYTCGCNAGRYLPDPSDRSCLPEPIVASPGSGNITQCGNDILEPGEECEVSNLGCSSENCKCSPLFPSDGKGNCNISQPVLRSSSFSFPWSLHVS